MGIRTIQKVFIVVATLLVASCASKSTLTIEERDQAYAQFIIDHKLERTDKISSFRFDQWTALGRKHIILYRNFRTPFLVTLQRNCFDLDHSFQLIVENKGSSLRAKFDYVMVPDLIPVKCFIESIHRLDNEQKKQLMAIGDPVDSEKKDKFHDAVSN